MFTFFSFINSAIRIVKAMNRAATTKLYETPLVSIKHLFEDHPTILFITVSIISIVLVILLSVIHRATKRADPIRKFNEYEEKCAKEIGYSNAPALYTYIKPVFPKRKIKAWILFAVVITLIFISLLYCGEAVFAFFSVRFNIPEGVLGYILTQLLLILAFVFAAFVCFAIIAAVIVSYIKQYLYFKSKHFGKSNGSNTRIRKVARGRKND